MRSVDWRRLFPAAALLAALGLAACAASPGSATALPQSSASALAPTPGASAPTAAPAAMSEGPSSTVEPAASQPSTGGAAGTGAVCDLVTVPELEAIFGVSGIKTTVFPGPPDTCQISDKDGGTLAALVMTPQGGRLAFNALHTGSVEDLTGLADGAFYSSDTQILIVLKGDAMLAIAGDPGLDEAKRIEYQKAIAAKAAGRM